MMRMRRWIVSGISGRLTRRRVVGDGENGSGTAIVLDRCSIQANGSVCRWAKHSCVLGI